MVQILTKMLNRVSPSLNIHLRAKKYKAINNNFPLKLDHVLNDVLANGYAVLPEFFSEEWCQACVEQIDDFIEKVPQYVHKGEDERLFGAHNFSLEIREFHDHEELQRYSDEYYGCKSLVNILLANRIHANPDVNLGSGGDWHRDRMIRQFKAIVYLTDVSLENGAFQYIHKSNTHHHKQFIKDSKKTGLSDKATRLTQDTIKPLLESDPERLKTFEAKKGSVILVDTSGIHRGAPVQDGERYALFNYYMPESEYDKDRIETKFSPVVPENYEEV